MNIQKAKYEHQVQLISSLRELAGDVSAGYASQMEFFIITLQNMAEHLMDLKREMLKESCAAFTAELDKPSLTDEAVVEFRSSLDKLVSGKDFSFIDAGITGSRQLIKSRISMLRPMSVVDEERKGKDRDRAADQLVSTAYKRLQFEALERDLVKNLDDASVDKALARARERVADYCCLYQVPMREDDTLTPFSLSRIDSVVGSCFRLMIRIREIREKYM
jgi:hypothetical protein